MCAGVALGQYLSQRDNASHKRFKPAHNLGGLPGTLDPMLWVCFLNGAFTNTPSLRPEVVFLPGADLSESTECLMHWQSAQAVAQAEGIFAGLGDPEIRCGSNGVALLSVGSVVLFVLLPVGCLPLFGESSRAIHLGSHESVHEKMQSPLL